MLLDKHYFHLLIDFLKLPLEHEYNLNVVKEIKVTESFLSLDESTKGCQNKETLKVKNTRKILLTFIIFVIRNVYQMLIKMMF